MIIKKIKYHNKITKFNNNLILNGTLLKNKVNLLSIDKKFHFMKVLIKKIKIIMEENFFKMIVLKNKIFNLIKEKYFKIIKA
jgi:hypothetical protein